MDTATLTFTLCTVRSGFLYLVPCAIPSRNGRVVRGSSA